MSLAGQGYYEEGNAASRLSSKLSSSGAILVGIGRTAIAPLRAKGFEIAPPHPSPLGVR
jgi:hypothetical protein